MKTRTAKAIRLLARKTAAGLSFCLFTFAFCLSANAARVKDLGQIEGFRANQLFGFGLVAGLTGTGDKQNTEFTVQTLANLLQDYNIRVNPNDVQVKNVAAVMVTAEVPAFVQPGTTAGRNHLLGRRRQQSIGRNITSDTA